MLPPPSIFAPLFQFCFSYFLHKFINKRHFPFKETPPPPQVPNPYIPLPPPHIRHPPPFLIRNVKHPLKFVFEYIPSRPYIFPKLYSTSTPHNTLYELRWNCCLFSVSVKIQGA